ncbi:MAG: DEAD/DEAH box helicase [Verrucomicrobiales bacterium]
MNSLLDDLHPTLGTWMKARHSKATDAQSRALPSILANKSMLLSAPTGSGKTLAAFLGVFHQLLEIRDREGELPKGIFCVYVSPLRALAYDQAKNLSAPLVEMGLHESIRIGRRTGDSSAKERADLKSKPPHILLTTPESLAVLLAQEAHLVSLGRTRFLVIDEIHSLAANARGAHLMISAERIEELTGEPLVRIGLSATAAPLALLGEYLVGPDRQCVVVESHERQASLVELYSPLRNDPYPAAGYSAQRLLEELADLLTRHRTVLIFTNTRSGAESLGLRLKQVLPDLASAIEIHHSSLDRELRQQVEDRLKQGELRAVVCSTSLEMGIDIGAIDLVVMVSAPKGVSRTLQRIGRSGHSIHQSSHGILVASNVSDLVECAVTVRLTQQKTLEPVTPLEEPLDVIAQHVVGMVMTQPRSCGEMLETLRRSWTCRDLSEGRFRRILRYLEGGGASLERQYRESFGKIEFDEATGRYALASKKVSREYLMNVGSIVTEGMVRVKVGRRLWGEVEESFVRLLKVGDAFVLNGRVLRLKEMRPDELVAVEAKSTLPNVPRWNASKMPLSSGLAKAVTQLRGWLHHQLAEKNDVEVVERLVEEWELSQVNARAMVGHFKAQKLISEIPRAGIFLIEVVDRDEALHVFFHSLIGRSANDALSRIVALRLERKVGGNAMTTIDDYGFLLSIQPWQNLDLQGWKELFAPENAKEDLREGLRSSQLVRWQFRGVSQTAMMVPRNLPGQERSRRQLNWSGELLFQVLQEHEPDHVVLEEAYRQAEHTFLQFAQAEEFLGTVGQLDWVIRELPMVSPFAFPMYVSKIREAMVMEDPSQTLERLMHEMYASVAEA